MNHFLSIGRVKPDDSKAKTLWHISCPYDSNKEAESWDVIVLLCKQPSRDEAIGLLWHGYYSQR